MRECRASRRGLAWTPRFRREGTYMDHGRRNDNTRTELLQNRENHVQFGWQHRGEKYRNSDTYTRQYTISQ